MLTPIVAAIVLSPQHARTHVRMQRHTHVRKMRKAPNEEPAIRAGYAEVTRAFETKNWNLFRSRVTSNFQEELPNHKVLNLRQSMAELRRDFAPLSDIKAHFNIQQIKLNGSRATVEGRFWADGKFRDKKGRHKMHVEGSETDSLKKMGGRWLAYYVKIHDQSASVDGHVVSHMP